MNWYSKYLRASSESGRIMYHIGPRFPHPQPGKKVKVDDLSWIRPHKSYHREEKVVFLTPNFVRVWNNHGRKGNVYIFEVPLRVIREAGGIHEYDWASELIVPEHLWQYVKFKGKIDEGRAAEIVKQKSNNFPVPLKAVEIKPVSIGSIVRWMDETEHGYKKGSLFFVTDIKRGRATLKYLGFFVLRWSFDISTKDHKRKWVIEKEPGVPEYAETNLLHLTVDEQSEQQYEEITKL